MGKRSLLSRLNPQRAVSLLSYVGMFSDWRSIQNWRLLIRDGNRLSQPMPLRVRGFQAPIYCRPGTTDATVFSDAFWGKYHLPPPNLFQVERILDLGSNVGFTLADYARRYPKARILGIELDRENWRMCCQNIEPFCDRCSVLHGAAWFEEGEVAYAGESEFGFHVAAEGRTKVRAYAISSLIHMLGDSVDFLKMDVEGAEREILAHCSGWIHKTRCLKIELHRGYAVHDCIHQLEAFGFSCRLDRRRAETVIATRVT